MHELGVADTLTPIRQSNCSRPARLMMVYGLLHFHVHHQLMPMRESPHLTQLVSNTHFNQFKQAGRRQTDWKDLFLDKSHSRRYTSDDSYIGNPK